MAKKRRSSSSGAAGASSNRHGGGGGGGGSSAVAASSYAANLSSSSSTTTTTQVLTKLYQIATSPASHSLEILNAFIKGSCILELPESSSSPKSSKSSSKSKTAAAAAAGSSPTTLTRSSLPSSSPSAVPSNNDVAESLSTSISDIPLDCYWIVLATNILNRLLLAENDDDGNDEQQQERLTYMVSLSDIMTSILLVDKNKLEKASHPATSRSVLTRAILTATEACKFVVERYVVAPINDVPTAAAAPSVEEESKKKPKTQQRKKKTTRKAKNTKNTKSSTSSSAAGAVNSQARHQKLLDFDTLSAAVEVLDRLVYFKSTAEKGAETLSLAMPWKIEELKTSCEHVNAIIGDDISQETLCVLALLDPSSQNEQPLDSPPSRKKKKKSSSSRSKRARGSAGEGDGLDSSSSTRMGEQNAAIVSSFQSLLESNKFGIQIEGRVSIKRWASIPLVWSVHGDGQLKMLQAAHRIKALPTTPAAVTRKEGITLSQKSSVILRVMDVVAEAGDICLARPPSGGIDEYLKFISPSGTRSDLATVPPTKKYKSESKKRARGSSSPKTPQRVDVRDWAVVVINDFLQCHKESLEATQATNISYVNDNVEEHSAIESSSGQCHFSVTLSPTAGRTITKLCRSASSNGVNSNYSKQAESTKIMTGIAVALSIEILADHSLPLDCKLADFVLKSLSDSVRIAGLQSQGGPSSTTPVTDDKLKSSFLLLENLPSPVAPEVVEFFDGSNEKCTFGGMLPQGSNERKHAADEQVLALAIRALLPYHENPLSMFWTFHADLVQRIYQYDGSTDGEKGPGDPGEDASSQAGGKRKRQSCLSSSSVSKQRANQRRKTEDGATTVKEMNSLTRRLTPDCCSVAEEAMNVLRFCLSQSDQPGCKLKRALREDLTTVHLLSFVKLGEMIENALVFHRNAPSSGPSSGVTASERALWSSHLNFCKVLGRGRLYHEVEKGLDEEIWNGLRRLHVYESIASPDNQWPLALPEAHKVFLMASLSCIQNTHDKTPERYLVKAYIDSISDALRKTLAKTDSSTGKICPTSSLNHAIPLSYYDCRVCLSAFLAISGDEKRQHIERLVKDTTVVLKSFSTDDTRKEALGNDADISGFISRVLVLLVALTQSLYCSCAELDAFLMGNVGRSDVNIPGGSLGGTSDNWYTRDSSFMGLFDDWESATLPEGFSNTSMTYTRSSVLGDLKELLDLAFAVGFEAAKVDQGRLLFTSWNQLDQLPSPSSNMSPTRLSPQSDDLPRRILEMREDVCMVQSAIQKEDKSISPSRMKQILIDMVGKSSTILDSVLETNLPKHNDSKTDVQIPVQVFVFLSSIPVYVASAISGFTTAGSDYFSESLRRSKPSSRRPHSFSQGSDGTSDGESLMDVEDFDHDTRSEVLSHLYDCSEALGAAPTHPDWLDFSCTLRGGVQYADVVDMSDIAMRALTRLMSVSMKEYKKNQIHAAEVLCVNDDKPDMRADTCVSLMQLSNQRVSNGDWNNKIASVTGVPVAFMTESECCSYDLDLDNIKASWCPNSGQRLRGYLQNGNTLRERPWDETSQTLRAGGEWEILLSEALAVSCVRMDGISKNDIFEARRGIDKTDAFGAISNARMWKMVTTATVQNMAPVAALLRFGISKGGRSRHTFANNKEGVHEDNLQYLYDRIPVHIVERPNSNEAVPFSVSATISTCLTLLARLSVEESAYLCSFVSSQLVVDTRSFDNLGSLLKIRCACIALDRLLSSSWTPSKRKKKKKLYNNDREDALAIINSILAMVQEFGCGDTSEIVPSTSEAADEFPILSAYFSKGGMGIETVVHSSTTIENVVSQSKWIGKWTEFEEDNIETFEWFTDNRQGSTIRHLVELLFGQHGIQNKTRFQIARLLSAVAKGEFYSVYAASHKSKEDLSVGKTVVVPAIRRALDDHLDKKWVHELAKDLHEGSTLALHQGEILSLLLAYDSVHFARAPEVLDVLLSVKMPKNLLTPLLTYGMKNKKLVEIGASLLRGATTDGNLTQANKSEYFDLLVKFLSSIKKLKVKLEDNTAVTQASQSKTEDDRRLQVLSKKTCSYQSTQGFKEQHWYTCATCGLTENEGCCTLCALVCHKGHDVSYSRFSSFFCDCGAPSEETNASSKCRCQATLSVQQLLSAFEKENVLDWMGQDYDELIEEKRQGQEVFLPVDIASFSFRKTALDSVQYFCSKMNETEWLGPLFSLLEDEKTLSMENNVSTLAQLLGNPLNGKLLDIESSSRRRVCHDEMKAKLANRKEKILHLSLSTSVLSPVAAWQGLSALYSSSSSMHASIVRKLARHESVGHIMDADSRGRVIMAESSKLSFFTLPEAGTKPRPEPEDLVLSRHSLGILCTTTMPFAVIGVKVCPENDRFICVYGLSEACMVVTSPQMHKVEFKLGLEFVVGANEPGDCILGALFVSQVAVAVWSSKFIRIYQIAKGGEKEKIKAKYEYGMTENSSIRSMSMVSGRTLVVMLDNGRLHTLHLGISGGNIVVPSQFRVEPTSCMPIPTIGIATNRSVPSSIRDAPTGFARTLGEGCSTYFLQQSSILLYQTKRSNPVVAILLDEAGNSQGSFMFLPHELPKEILGESASSITGPYTHFTELGVVYNDNGETFFRVAATAECSGTSSQRVIIIEFCDSQVTKVNVLQSSSFNLPVSSFQGLCSFSLPLVLEKSDKVKQIRCSERVFLAGITTGGNILLWGEDLVDLPSNGVREGHFDLVSLSREESTKITHPLTIFEHMTNITEDDDLHFCVANMEPTNIKKSLLKESSPFFCPQFEGATLMISFKSTTKAIAAVRILIGSSGSSFNPSFVRFVGGGNHKIPITSGQQQWVNLPLTKEEIARGVRQAAVPILIGPTHDSSSRPVLDAVEIFAIDKPKFIEKSYFTNNITNASFDVQEPIGLVEKIEKTLDTLLIVAEMSENSAHGQQLRLRSEDDMGHQWPSMSSHGQHAPLVVLCKAVAKNPSKPLITKLSKVLDLFDTEQQITWVELVLEGCTEIFAECEICLEGDTAGGDDKKWMVVKVLVQQCIQTLLFVSRRRPASFFSATQGMNARSAVQRAGSLAHKILERSTSSTLIRDLTHLVLTEAAVDVSKKPQIELMTNSVAMLSVQCKAIYEFLSQGVASEIIQRIEAARVVAFACDSCGCCPIKKQRYTLPEGSTEIDLCEKCYKEGLTYAEKHKWAKTAVLIVNKSTVTAEDGYTLLCHDVKNMKMILLESEKIVEGNDIPHENSERKTSVYLSNLLDVLFNTVKHYVQDEAAQKGTSATLDLLLSSCLKIVSTANDGTWRIEKVTQVADIIVSLILNCLKNESNDDSSTVVSLVHALSKLVDIDDSFVGAVSKIFMTGGGTVPPHELLCRHFSSHLITSDASFWKILAKKGKVSCDNVTKSLFTLADAKAAYDDGVFASKEKLNTMVSADLWMKERFESSTDLSAVPDDWFQAFFNAVLELLPKIADDTTVGVDSWMSLLSKVYASSQDSWKNAASRAMKMLCKNKIHLYHDCRDHFLFLSHLENLYYLASPIITAAIIVRDKAQACNSDWSPSQATSSLNMRDFIGTANLISEDIVSDRRLNDIDGLLNSLVEICLKRSYWRRFASLGSLSLSGENDTAAAKMLADVSPSVALFLIACTVTGNIQGKLLKLLHLAFIPGNRSDRPETNSPLLGDPDMTASTPFDLMTRLVERGALNEEDLVRFAMALVAGGKTGESRSYANRIFVKLCELPLSKSKIFNGLLPLLQSCAASGKGSVEVLDALSKLSSLLSEASNLEGYRINKAGQIVSTCFLFQVSEIKYGRSNGEWEVIDVGSSTKRRFCLSNCNFCIQQSVSSDQRTNRLPVSNIPGRAAAVSSNSASSPSWHPDQVGSFFRSKLDSGRDFSSGNEFSKFYKLKHRHAIKEIDLKVTDARGRHIKTLNIYLSPRPVSALVQLENCQWEKAATISVGKTVSRAKATFPVPLVAGAVKVEFAEFYERPGEQQDSEDGSAGLAVFCPRCHSAVKNAHGVCHNCGEMALQCRKCRHINYDKLDAFFCVECGYCPNGSFSFEIVSGVATNSVAITNDQEYEQTMKMHGVASSICTEIKATLREKIRTITDRKKPKDQLDTANFFPVEMQDAFTGLPPGTTFQSSTDILGRFEKPGSVVKAVAQPDMYMSSGNDNTGSSMGILNRLSARLPEGSGLSGEGGTDRTSSQQTSGGLPQNRSSSKDSKTPAELARLVQSRKKETDECQKLHVLMREASREAFELGQRIDAWRGLESGQLVSVSSLDNVGDQFPFLPCQCSACGPSVALQLLLLWLNIFFLDPSTVEVESSFLDALFEEIPGQSSGLGDSMKSVVVSIAMKSDKGAQQVLEILKRRLKSSKSDRVCAEVLGKIMENKADFPTKAKFTMLAMDTLSSM